MPHATSARLLPVPALAAALGVLWLVHFHPFAFPNNDFYSYRRAAWSLQAGELPKSTKRGPIFPAAIAALAPAMPGEQPELAAALAVNLACSVALFLALARFARRTFPEAALLFAVLLATTPVLHAAALQPLLEPTLGLFVALAFLGLGARSPLQYAAAGAAALSRPDAIVLVAILAVTNALFERDRAIRHAALAALAAVPCLVWYSLGARDGASTYMALREAYGAGAFAYLAVLPKEIFPASWRPAPLKIATTGLFAAVAAFGAWRAWRRAPRETTAMLAWFAGSCAIVVLYGVGKTRYVHPIAFVPLLCFAVGCVALASRVATQLGALGPRWLLAARFALGPAILGLVVPPLVALALVSSGLPAWPDWILAFLAAIALSQVLDRPREGRTEPVSVATAWIYAIALALALGGVARYRMLLAAVYDFDRAAAAAARWVEVDLPPGERVAALHYSQIKFAAPAARERVVPFHHLEAETLDELRAALAREGVRYVAWTWRRAPETQAEQFYAERRKEALAAPFGTGGPVAGFEHVATLPAEPRLEQPPAQIYRLQ